MAKVFSYFFPAVRRMATAAERRPIHLESKDISPMQSNLHPDYDIPSTLKMIHGESLSEFGSPVFPKKKPNVPETSPISNASVNTVPDGYDLPPTLRIIHGEGDIF